MLPAALALLLACAAAGCGGDGAGPSPVQFGFNEDVTPASIRLQAQVGMPVVRFKVPWDEVEPQRGRWDFARFDALYDRMRAAGLRPLLLAVGAPCWARAPGGPCGVPGPAFDADWSGYVGRLATRYPDAIGVEVWNEENGVQFFPPHPDPARYAELLGAAYRAAKSVDADLPVVSGGLLPAPATTRYATADARFLQDMYAAGAAGSMDAIGAHPYPLAAAAGGGSRYDLGAMERYLQRLRAVRDAAGQSSTPIWITEVGVSTESVRGFPPGVSGAEQASSLLALLDRAEQDPDVRVVLIHRLVGPNPTPAAGPLGRLELGFGVFEPHGVPKPAACALSERFGGSLSC